MPSNRDMLVKFWGVRGSIACPGAATARYGGNTSCVELQCGEHLLIFDAGTGLRELGNALKLNDGVQASIFLSHCHFDHICGLPFFAPFFHSGSRVRLWAGNLLPDFKLVDVIGQMMSAPLFPIRRDIFDAKIEYRDFLAGASFAPVPGVTMHTIRLNHPDGATGYRVEYHGGSVAYITDHELENGALDQSLVSFLLDVDILIYDCTYTTEELLSHIGWGHSSWQQGLELASKARAKTFCLFHHDPDHDDDQLDSIAAQVSAQRPGSLVAREGLVLEV